MPHDASWALRNRLGPKTSGETQGCDPHPLSSLGTAAQGPGHLLEAVNPVRSAEFRVYAHGRAQQKYKLKQ